MDSPTYTFILESEYSFLDGRARTSEVAAQAVAHGDEACAITDHDEVGGHIDSQKACQAAGIKPIFGPEARWLRDIEASREAKTSGHDNSHIILLAENSTGLRNMWALSSLAYEKKYFYNKPQLTPELMGQYREGLWASDGCLLTRFAEYVWQDKEDLARQELGILQGIFGDRFYMELHTWQILEPSTLDRFKFYGEEIDSVTANDMARKINQAKIRFAEELSVPLVVVNDCHYARKSQWREHKLVWAMSTFKKDQTEAPVQAADWMMDTDEIHHWMAQFDIAPTIVEEAIKNTGWIAEQCNVEIKPHLQMPRLYASDEEDRAAFVRAVEEGFKRKVESKVDNPEVYRERLDYEVGLILDKGMAGYFNVVADYTRAGKTGSYADWVAPEMKKGPCLCGPGRGSGGGSLVNYLMDITSLDPIHYDLMFERFINPDRLDPPDIDVDFPKSKRQGLLSYLGARYGQGRVVPIGTRSRSGPPALLADLAKAMLTVDNMAFDYRDIVEIRKQLEEVYQIEEEDVADADADPITWDEVLQEMGGDLAPFARKYPLLFERMGQLLGIARQSGVHAAGVIVSNEDVLGHIPTRRKPGGTGTLSTQFDMHELEWLGGVKDDLLAIRHLDTCEVARQFVLERHGVWLDFEGSGIGIPEQATEVITFGPDQYKDPEIWEPIHRGQTLGIFQIGTPSATRQTARFRPTNERELADLISINRPGVIRAGLLDHYLRRRRGEEEASFVHPMMREITGATYGILVYQEDLIKAAKNIAQFTPGEAEKLRKIIGKKLGDQMRALEPKFIEGCLTNPEFMAHFCGDRVPTDAQIQQAEVVALKIWSSLLASGAYAFNKSHAMGYSVQACWEIWLKCYYYVEWVAACLATDHRPGYPKRYVREARRFNHPILPPDINRSHTTFRLSPEGIRYGLTDIRDIGDSAADDIVAKQPYTSFADFLERVRKDRGGKKQVVENLIKLGAFECFESDRAELMRQYHFHRCLQEVAEKKRGNLTPEQASEIVATKQADPKRDGEFRIPRFHDPQVLTEIENELVGTFITCDPMGRYIDAIEDVCIQHPIEVDEYDPNEKFAIGGKLIRATPHQQKDGKQMAFLTIDWAEEEFEILAFAKAWEAWRPMLKVGAPVVCEVKKLSGRGCQLVKAHRLDFIFDG